MDFSGLDAVIYWVNVPIFHIGQTPVTLGGVGSAAIVFFGALMLSRFLQRAISNKLTEKLHLSSGAAYAIKRILHYGIVFFGVLLAAQCVGLNLGSLAVVFAFLGVGIGFGLQNSTSNFISGLILLFERPISVGDFVTLENQVGTVVQINMRATIIRTLDNINMIIPNSKFIENEVINWTHYDTNVRIHCPVGVAYGSDVPKVKEVLLAVAAGEPRVMKRPEPEVRFMEFGDSSLNFELLVWTAKPVEQFVLRSCINYAIDEAFRKAGIQIPFPQRDLHLKTADATLVVNRRENP